MPKVHYLEPMPWADNADALQPDTRPLTDAEMAEIDRLSRDHQKRLRMHEGFIPEDTPPAMTDRYEADKVLAEMDAALISPLFFVAVILALVTFVMIIITGTNQ
jgi:hypothetical protein